MRRLLTGRLLALAILLMAAVGPAAVSGAEPAVPVVVEGWVVDEMPAGEAGVPSYAVEVERVVHGQVPAGTVLVRIEPPGPAAAPSLRGAAPPRFHTGQAVYLVLRPDEAGVYSLVSWRPWVKRAPQRELSEPPGIVAAPLAPTEEEPPSLATKAAPTPTYEERVVELVNQERWTYNNLMLPPLKANALLEESAGGHSASMATGDFFAHCDLNTGDSVSDRILATGYFYNYAGENIAAGYSTPESVMAGWMASTGHRNNILSSNYREIGVGYELQAGDLANVRLDQNGDCAADLFNQGPYYRYWTQNFGRRNSVYPVVIDREAPSTTTTMVDLYVYGAGWAQDMRFSNDGAAWSSWEAYAPDKSWTLDSASGVKTVYAELRNGATVRQAEDQIYLDLPCTGYPATLELSMQTVTTTETHTACDWIRAGDSYAVESPGDVTLRARNRIILHNGFSVGAGAKFTATVDPSL